MIPSCLHKQAVPHPWWAVALHSFMLLRFWMQKGFGTLCIEFDFNKTWKSVVHWLGLDEEMNSTQKAQSCENTGQLMSISLHFQWVCCCWMLLSVGPILRTFLLKAVSALAKKSNVANLVPVTVILICRGWLWVVREMKQLAGVWSLVSSLLITRDFYSLLLSTNF